MFFLPVICTVILAWCLQNAAAAISNFFGPLRSRIFKNLPKDTSTMVTDQVLLAVTDPSPFANRTQALLFQALRLRNWRVNLMQFCFADLAWWGALAIGAVFFQIGGIFVLAAGGVALVLTSFIPKYAKPAAALAINVGLFLVIAELAMRSGGLVMGHDTTEISMLMADNRPLSLVLLTTVVAAIVALSGCEYLGFSAALLGLATGAISLNGAVAFVWGEHIGLSLRLFVESRRHVASIRKMAKISLYGDLVAWPVALVMLGFLRDGMSFAAPSQEEMLGSIANFLLLAVLTLIPFVLAQLVQGHWQGKTAPEDLMEKAESVEGWLKATSFRSSLIAFVLVALKARQDEIARLRNNFGDADWQKVPKPVREASDNESAHLHRSRQQIEAHLLSRSDFFNHQLR